MADDSFEEVLLGAPRKYSRQELAKRSGVPLEKARKLWRAMGFQNVGDDERIFTDADLDALQTLRRFEEQGLLNDETTLTSTRALGQQMARLADWQVNILTERLKSLGATAQPEELEKLVGEVADDVLPDLERILVLVWRRQLLANSPRALAAASGQAHTSNLVVGFADLVNYTRLSRTIDSQELADLLETFERRAALLMAEYGGRVVKTLGDEVMFTTDEPAAAAEIALGLVEKQGETDDLPEMRAGVAYGPVLSRLGDVFGEPVNLASRLTSLARPGTVLVDRELAAQLEDNPAYELSPIRRQSVRGYRNLEATALRRASVKRKEDREDK